MSQELNEFFIILILLLFGTSGNVLYRLNKSLKIKPFYIRLLMGAMSSIMYMLFFLISMKRQPIFKFNYLTACFVIGYFVEIILEKTDEILPNIIDKISTILLGGINDKNNKKGKE